jgi:hypothetical protein
MANDRNVSALVQVLRDAPAALTDDPAVKLGANAAGSIPTEPTEIAWPLTIAWMS